MIRTLIVDDEAPAREELIYSLKRFQEIEIIGEASHGMEAIKLNSKLKPDLIFLDIQMPKLNGIDVARRILDSNHKPYIVFVTAYEEYAIDAFEVNAMDYILKPITEERLEKGMEKVLDKVEKSGKVEIKRHEISNKICAYANGKLIPIDLKEIIYATVEDKNTVIFSTKGKYEVNYTLGELSERLNSPTFFRSHKSFLINLDHIEFIEPWFNSTFNVVLKNVDIKIPVSRGQSKEFRKLMNIN